MNKKKPVHIEVSQMILPDFVFEVVAPIPYEMQVKQILTNDKNIKE